MVLDTKVYSFIIILISVSSSLCLHKIRKMWYFYFKMLVNIIKEVTKPKPASGELDASLARDFKVTHSPLWIFVVA